MSQPTPPGSESTKIAAGDILFLPEQGSIQGSIIHAVIKNGELPFKHTVVVTDVLNDIFAEILVVTSWNSGQDSETTLCGKWIASMHKGYCQFQHSNRSQAWDYNAAGYHPLRTLGGREFVKPGSYLNMRTPYLVETSLLRPHSIMRGERLTPDSLEFVRGTWPKVQDAYRDYPTWRETISLAMEHFIANVPRPRSLSPPNPQRKYRALLARDWRKPTTPTTNDWRSMVWREALSLSPSPSSVPRARSPVNPLGQGAKSRWTPSTAALPMAATHRTLCQKEGQPPLESWPSLPARIVRSVS